MLQIQSIVLEKIDIEKLNSGQVVSLGIFDGKTVEVSFEKKRKYSNRWDPKSIEIKNNVLEYIKNSRTPVMPMAIATALNLPRALVHSKLTTLRIAKCIVNSTQGWRPVHTTTAKVGHSNGK